MLEVRNITKSFGKLVAIKDVSLSAREGAITGLIGPNGSGKTTMFNLISGFLKPNGGQVLFDGADITGKRPSRIASMGLVRTFQLTSIYRDRSVFENVMMGHHMARLGGVRHHAHSVLGQEPNLQKSAEGIIDFMGLAAVADTPAHLLPGGTQRMVSIATALAARPALLLLDEPLAGLHPAEKASVAQRLLDRRKRGLTMLLIEHDMKSVMSVCDEVHVINFGNKIGQGTPREITENPTVVEAYLGAAHHA